MGTYMAQVDYEGFQEFAGMDYPFLLFQIKPSSVSQKQASPILQQQGQEVWYGPIYTVKARCGGCCDLAMMCVQGRGVNSDSCTRLGPEMSTRGLKPQLVWKSCKQNVLYIALYNSYFLITSLFTDDNSNSPT